MAALGVVAHESFTKRTPAGETAHRLEPVGQGLDRGRAGLDRGGVGAERPGRRGGQERVLAVVGPEEAERAEVEEELAVAVDRPLVDHAHVHVAAGSAVAATRTSVVPGWSRPGTRAFSSRSSAGITHSLGPRSRSESLAS